MINPLVLIASLFMGMAWSAIFHGRYGFGAMYFALSASMFLLHYRKHKK